MMDSHLSLQPGLIYTETYVSRWWHHDRLSVKIAPVPRKCPILQAELSNGGMHDIKGIFLMLYFHAAGTLADVCNVW